MSKRNSAAFISGFVLLTVMVLVPNEVRADESEGVCIRVRDGGTDLFTLRVGSRSMLNPDSDDLLTVKAIVNGVEPLLGVSMRTGTHSVVATLSGTVAGFFNTMQLHWDPQQRTGTGRILGELTVHSSVQLAEISCR